MAAFFSADLPEVPAQDSDYVESTEDSESSFPSSDEEDVSNYDDDGISDEEASLEYRDLATDEEADQYAEEQYAVEPYDEHDHIPYEENTYLDEMDEMDEEEDYDEDEEPDYIEPFVFRDQHPRAPPVVPPTTQPSVIIPIAPYPNPRPSYPNPNHQPFLSVAPSELPIYPIEQTSYPVDQPTHIPITYFPEPLRQIIPFLPAQQNRPQTPPITPDASRKRVHQPDVEPPTPETTPRKEEEVDVKTVGQEEEEERPTKRRRTGEWDGVVKTVGQFTLAASLGAAATFAGLLWAAK